MVGVDVANACRTFHIPGRIVRHLALDHVTLTIEPGETMLLTGENGAGKSTLLRLIAGLTRPDRGSVMHRLPGGRRVDASRLRRADDRMLLGYLGPESGLYADLTVQENLELGAVLSRMPPSAVQSLIDRLRLGDHRHTLLRACSQGIARRTAAARAVIHDPVLLLLDEPTAHLDESGRAEIRAIVEERERAGATVIIATHDDIGSTAREPRCVVLAAGRVQEKVS